MQKRSEAKSKIAANKYDRLKREREKTIQRVRQKVSDKSKDEKKLPPRYLDIVYTGIFAKRVREMVYSELLGLLIYYLISWVVKLIEFPSN